MSSRDLVGSISAIDCMERLVSKITYCVSCESLNSTHLGTIVDPVEWFITRVVNFPEI